MFQLPKELQDLIYSFDNTYKLKFNEVLKLITKKYVSEFKYSKKYTYCNHCNIKVQYYYRHTFSVKHEYNATLQGYNKYYNTLANKILKYINKNNIIIKNKSQIINILQIIKLDKKELYALQHYYFNFNVPIKIVYNKLKCFTF